MRKNHFFRNLKKLKTYAHVKDVYIRLKIFLNDHLPCDYYCTICNHPVRGFRPFGIRSEIFNKLHIIGGGYRENCLCPICGSSDRFRWQYYVLRNFILRGLDKNKIRILHIAPESTISSFFKEDSQKFDYVTADLKPGFDLQVDICNMPNVKDNRFDLIIANHVLEHIIDEKAAMSELKRVLCLGGQMMISFPISTEIQTFQDDSITSEVERLEKYGQLDHVRLYGKDYIEHFEKYDLNVFSYSPMNEMDDSDIKKYGLIRDDVILVCSLKS